MNKKTFYQSFGLQCFILVFFSIGTLQAQRNYFAGENSGVSNQGVDNTFIGSNSGATNTSGEKNTFVGSASGRRNTTGLDNSMLGYATGPNNTTGRENVFIGSRSGFNNTEGSANIFVGFIAGMGNTTGIHNTFIGWGSGVGNSDGRANTFIGYSAGQSSNSSANTFVGMFSGADNTIGSGNTLLGYQAGFHSVTADHNTFVGFRTGENNSSGGANSFLGTWTGFNTTTGVQNTFIGYRTGFEVTTGSRNTFLGTFSGLNTAVDIAGSVFIGYEAGNSEQSSNRLHIANNRDRTLIYGEFDNERVGIATTDLSEKFQVAGAIRIGNSDNAVAGTIRWNGNDFEGRKENAWVSLSAQGLPSGWELIDNGNVHFTEVGNIGIGTNNPQAKLHINRGAFLFDDEVLLLGNNYPTTFRWIPSGGALRLNLFFNPEGNLIGEADEQIGKGSVAMGMNAKASGYFSFGMGEGVVSESRSGFVVGGYNEINDEYSATAWRGTDPLFVVGNGANEQERHNALTILKNGNVGIGTSTPTYDLEVESGAVLFNSRTDVRGSLYDVFLKWVPGRGALRTNLFFNEDGSLVQELEPDMGRGSVAMGMNAKAPGYFALGMGEGVISESRSCTVVGSYNERDADYHAVLFQETDPIFVVGNGRREDSRRNALTILKNGNIGIGTKSPDHMLQVEEGGVFYNSHSEIRGQLYPAFLEWVPDRGALRTNFYFDENGDLSRELSEDMGRGSVAMGMNAKAPGYFALGMGEGVVAQSRSCAVVGSYNELNDNYNNVVRNREDAIFVVGNGNSEEERSNALTILRNGKVGIGLTDVENNYTLEVAGNTNTRGLMYANGVLLVSDQRYKEELEEVIEGRALLQSLRPIKFRYNQDLNPERNFDGGVHIGFMAQEVQEILPDLVEEDEEGFLAMDYIGLLPIVIKAAQEMVDELEELEEENHRLQEQIQNLEQKDESLEAQNEELRNRLEELAERVSTLEEDKRQFSKGSLRQNIPNPFNQTTKILYFLPDATQQAQLYLFDMNGKMLKEFKLQGSGNGEVVLESSSLSAGIYIYSLIINGKEIDSKRMILTK